MARDAIDDLLTGEIKLEEVLINNGSSYDERDALNIAASLEASSQTVKKTPARLKEFLAASPPPTVENHVSRTPVTRFESFM